MFFQQPKPILMLFACALGLSACVPENMEQLPKQQSDSCDSGQYEHMLWKPKSVLDGLSLPRGTRVIGPDQAVTMDFRPNRLNITYGKLGRIERVYCG